MPLAMSEDCLNSEKKKLFYNHKNLFTTYFVLNINGSYCIVENNLFMQSY